MSLEALGNTVLDDLKDVPAVVIFPAGAHVCKQQWSSERKDTGVVVKVTLTHVETRELATNVSLVSPEVAPGSEASVSFNLANDYRQGQFKAIVESYREQLQAPKDFPVAEILAAVNGSTGLFIITNDKAKKADNNGKHTIYMGIQAVTLLG